MIAALIAYGIASTALLAWAIVYGVPLRCQFLERYADRVDEQVADLLDREDDLHGSMASLNASLNDAHATETRLRQQLAQAVAKLHEAHTATEWPSS